MTYGDSADEPDWEYNKYKSAINQQRLDCPQCFSSRDSTAVWLNKRYCHRCKIIYTVRQII